MSAHHKALQHMVRVSETRHALAKLLPEPFGGPQDALADGVDEKGLGIRLPPTPARMVQPPKSGPQG
jgi:hypothetical protein